MANGAPLGGPAMSGEDLRSLRDRIDAIDEDIVRLLAQRVFVANGSALRHGPSEVLRQGRRREHAGHQRHDAKHGAAQ